MEPLRRKCSNCQRTATLESPHGHFCTAECATAVWQRLPVEECARLRAAWADEAAEAAVVAAEAEAAAAQGAQKSVGGTLRRGVRGLLRRSRSMTRLAASAIVGSSSGRARDAAIGDEAAGDAAAGDEAPEPVRVRVDAVDLCAVGLSREDKGRAWWTALHSMAYELEDDAATGRLPPAVRAAAEAIANALTHVYPCGLCRGNYVKMHAAHPPAFVTAADARTWFCDRHNDVTRRRATEAAAAAAAAPVGAEAGAGHHC